MKKLIFILLFTTVILNGLYAIPEYHAYNLRSKDNPFYFLHIRKRPTTNSVHMRKHNNISILEEKNEFYKYSINSLSDSLFNRHGSFYQVWNYDANGLLEDYKSSYINSSTPNYVATYKYDQTGRVIEETIPTYRTEFYYNEEDATSIGYVFSDVHNKWLPSLKHVYAYTTSGYDCHTHIYEYESGQFVYDDQGFIRYIFDSENRLEKIELVFPDKTYPSDDYEYSTDGYTRITYSGYDPYTKEIYRFNDHSDNIKYEKYNWEYGRKEWYLDHIIDYTYDYSGSVSNEKISDNQFKAYGINTNLIIETSEPISCYIYSLSGKLVKSVFVKNVEKVNLSKGIYIVTYKNKSQKVIVR